MPCSSYGTRDNLLESRFSAVRCSDDPTNTVVAGLTRGKDDCNQPQNHQPPKPPSSHLLSLMDSLVGAEEDGTLCDAVAHFDKGNALRVGGSNAAALGQSARDSRKSPGASGSARTAD